MCTFLVLNLLRKYHDKEIIITEQEEDYSPEVMFSEPPPGKITYILSHTSTQSKLQPSQYFREIAISITILDGRNIHSVMDPGKNSLHASMTGSIPKMTFLLNTFFFQ